MRILIAEDDVTSRTVLVAMLRKSGHDVVETVNGAAAWDALQQPGAPALGVLDWMMPEMDGQEALKAIRRMEKTRGLAGPGCAKIIMTTALADQANVMKARQQRCDSFLVKPIQKARLLEELRRLALIA